MEAARLQTVGDFLGEATAGGRDLVLRRDFEGRLDDGVDGEGRQRRDRLAPKAMVG